MRKITKTLLLVMGVLFLAACGGREEPLYEPIEPIMPQIEQNDEKITIYLPYEIFFSIEEEEFFLSTFEEIGGVITHQGGHIEVAILEEIAYAFALGIEYGIHLNLEAVVEAFESIVSFEKALYEDAAFFIFFGDFIELHDELVADYDLEDWLFSGVFYEMAMGEYFRRAFMQYDMSKLENIIIAIENPETGEFMQVYDFFHETLVGFSILHNQTTTLDSEKITIHIPRELFFSYGSEEFFLFAFEEMGGVVTPPEVDVDAFWSIYPANAGTVYIEVSFPAGVLSILAEYMEDDIYFYMEIIVEAFDSLLDYIKESDAAATRLIFIGDFEGFAADDRAIEVLDFLFPEMGEAEYLRRLFMQYDMSQLSSITFYIQDFETGQLTQVYDFFADAPEGLAMRHN